MAKYYVYTYEYPESMGGAIFYVGKGQGGRINEHEWEVKRGATHKGYRMRKHEIIRSIWQRGEQVTKRIVFETDDEREALDYECALIREHGAALVNIMHNTSINPMHVASGNKVLLSGLAPFNGDAERRYQEAVEGAKRWGLWDERQEERLRCIIFRPEEYAQRIQQIVERFYSMPGEFSLEERLRKVGLVKKEATN